MKRSDDMTSHRAESAPPTRGRDEQVPPEPIPKSTTAKSRPPINPKKAPKPPTEAMIATPRPNRVAPPEPKADHCSLAMSRTESILVSSSGDVLVSRCRRSSTPYLSQSGQGYGESLTDPWTNLIPCCDADIIAGIDSPWSPGFEARAVREQIVGDASTSQASGDSTYEWEKLEKLESKTGKKTQEESTQVPVVYPHSERTVSTPTLEKMADFNAYDGEILPLPSFDYSHIQDGHNDMLFESSLENSPLTPVKNSTTSRRKGYPLIPTILESPEEKKDEPAHPEDVSSPMSTESSVCLPQPFFHGVPVFLSNLSQIRITKVSAHPLGAHVLLISEDALFFTYGLNHHGQLGMGIKSSIKDPNQGFRTTPTLITPVLENGGKAINCAAGIDHSLVVIATEGRRLHKLHTNPEVAHSDHGALSLSRNSSSSSRLEDDDSAGTGHSEDDGAVRHHQVYGFGNNDFMKIGLVSAKLADDGAEGDVEDILLPRRVALHCTVWPQKGSPTDDALPPEGIFDISASGEHSAALVRRPTGDVEVYMWGNATLGALGLPLSQDPDVLVHDGTSRRPKSTANNIFPLPTVLESLTYRPNRELSSRIGFAQEVSLGPYCSFVVMSTGRCMSFGFSAEGMLGQGYNMTHTMDPKEVFLPSVAGEHCRIVSVKAGAFHVLGITEDGDAYSWGMNSDDRLGHGADDHRNTAALPPGLASKEGTVVMTWTPQHVDILNASRSVSNASTEDASFLVKACAGYDCSMLVARSGHVYSFGKRSGRLGKGEIAENVRTPELIHGGLRLFQTATKKTTNHTPRPRSLALMKRMMSDGAVNLKAT